jgi:hypothetical protein
MSRPIEFRAWDTVNRTIEYFDGLDDFCYFYRACCIDPNTNIGYRAYSNGEQYQVHFEIEQWTGLYDKNKVKIFEGDKLRSCRKYRYMYEAGYEGEIRHRDHFADYEYGDMGGQLTQTKADFCEVIGNVHE